MKKAVNGTVFFLVMAAISLLSLGTSGKAKVLDVTIYDEMDNFWTYEDDRDELDEKELFFPGDSGTIKIEESSVAERVVKVEYTSGDTSVVRVDELGNYVVLKEGKAVVYVKGWDEEGELVYQGQKIFYVGGDVSRTTLKKTRGNGYIFAQGFYDFEMESLSFPLVNAPDLTYCCFEPIGSSNPNMGVEYSLDREKKTIVVTASGAGSTVLTFQLNGKTFTISLKVTNVLLNKSSLLLAVKKKNQLKLKGYTGSVTWVSTNKKVASVSKKGMIKAKKTGNTVVYAKVGSHKLGCALSVTTAKMVKVIRAGQKMGRTWKYSQAKRMSKGYYDCSALVWKSYRKAGRSLINSSYAPVAADLAKWCNDRKRMIKGGVSEKNIRKMKLQPGDLVFPDGQKNGRYKGVYHVEMFAGYECYGFQGNKPILLPCWANRGPGYGIGCRLVGRP